MSLARKNARAGSSLIEVMVAAAILGITSAFTMTALDDISKARKLSLGIQGRHDIAFSLVENIRDNVGMFQISYEGNKSTTGSPDVMLTEDKLPYAWSNAGIMSAADCPQCPGRYGYLIQPMDGFRGLYIVTLRMTNKELFEGIREYRFITTIK
jgi:prepilin-type N-terminal cleavage/methylation domain-containing protein